jgi:hypothetical protein
VLRVARLIAGLLTVMTLVVGPGVTPAHAAPSVELGHWTNFRWGPGTESLWPVRAFYVLDRSADATVGAALRQVIEDLRSDLTGRGAWGMVPAPLYLENNVYAGQCDSTPWSGGGGFQSMRGYSFITVCAGGRGNGTSVTWTSGQHAADPNHPSIHVQREYPDFNTTYTALAHELLHALGVGHTSDCNDLMGGAEYGCGQRAGVLKRPSAAGYDAVTSFYGGYGAWGHAWHA